MNDKGTGRALRYSERRRLSETGSLGDLVHEYVPDAIRQALFHILFRTARFRQVNFAQEILNRIATQYSDFDSDWAAATPLGPGRSVNDLLDYCEIVVEASLVRTTHGRNDWRPFVSDLSEQINALFETHRFGYRISHGQVERLDSPLLHAEIVGPALLAAQRAGWAEVEERYRSAILRHRGGETADALTDANAAVESALLAVGLSGNTTGALAKSLVRSNHIAPYAEQVRKKLKDLIDELMVWRSNFGDAHGDSPDSQEAPQELAGLAIHWAGSFIVFLEALTRPS